MRIRRRFAEVLEEALEAPPARYERKKTALAAAAERIGALLTRAKRRRADDIHFAELQASEQDRERRQFIDAIAELTAGGVHTALVCPRCGDSRSCWIANNIEPLQRDSIPGPIQSICANGYAPLCNRPPGTLILHCANCRVPMVCAHVPAAVR